MTSFRDERRTSWIRSASCGVVTEPSTSDRSYGPSTVALLASRKYAISISPASASSSSSQSSSDSWQPSQEANFQTASVGLRVSVGHSSRTPIRSADLVVAIDRAVAADQRRAELAVAAVAEPAAHVALHRDVDPLGAARRARASARAAKCIMISGPQTNATVESGSKRAPPISFGTTPTLPRQPPSAVSTVTSTCRSKRPRRRCELARGRGGPPACGCRRAAPRRRTRRAARAPGRRPAAAARARCRRRRRRRRPAAASTGHHVPERAAHAEHVAGRAAQIASVTAPTARTVWTSGRPAPETEIGTSPTRRRRAS